MLNGKLVYVAGATGLAGSSIVRSLVEKFPKVRVRAGYYKNTKPFLDLPNVEFVQGDMEVTDDCKKALKGCNYAILTAASTGGVETIRISPASQLNANLIMNARMLEACYQMGVKRIVYVGSATLYQAHDGYISEHQLDLMSPPAAPYEGIGWVVRYLEQACEFWHKEYGQEIIIARCANIFGPYDKFQPGVSHFIPALIRKAVEQSTPYEVWGAANVTRDVIYCDDFARAVIGLMCQSEIVFDKFNIGSGLKTTVGDVVDCIARYTGLNKSNIHYVDNGQQSFNFRALDCSKLQQTLNWNIQQPIESSIIETIEWWKANKNWWYK